MRFALPNLRDLAIEGAYITAWALLGLLALSWLARTNAYQQLEGTRTPILSPILRGIRTSVAQVVNA